MPPDSFISMAGSSRSAELKVVSAMNIKSFAIEFKVTLLKHHKGIGAVKLVTGIIKSTVSKSVTGPNQVKMDDKELR